MYTIENLIGLSEEQVRDLWWNDEISFELMSKYNTIKYENNVAIMMDNHDKTFLNVMQEINTNHQQHIQQLNFQNDMRLAEEDHNIAIIMHTQANDLFQHQQQQFAIAQF